MRDRLVGWCQGMGLRLERERLRHGLVCRLLHVSVCGLSSCRSGGLVFGLVGIGLVGIGLVGIGLVGNAIAGDEDEDKDFARRILAANHARIHENMPMFYEEVITPEQRLEINDIHRRYAARISKLQEQIQQLEAERGQAIVEVLTDDQMLKVEDLMRRLVDFARRNRSQRKMPGPAAEQFLRRFAEEDAKGLRLKPLPRARNSKEDNRAG